ncbi:hypothetical protein C6P46_005078 [Rhodotorula mucilaginosa]|uniref:Uncharacterized protein n=1 Tax=Rhodotorula mucilaginosa TaxID=5537 RepID=A0A9P6VYL3_RHOMI|nr:hypothetical protein C6P46_005078 [Rhodotorula mucilaginosa]TKA53853.1 hypothetical protein B0A53_03643 [Rhodotorula sp. CCFEE 5036]
MKFSITAAVLALATAVSAQTINTPTALYTCEPYQIVWSGGAPPYYLRVLEGGTTSNVIETLVSAQDVTSYTWNVNVAAGTSVTLGLTDSTGTSAYAAQVTVQEGSSTSCVGQAASGSASAAPTGSSSLASSAGGAATSASSAASSASSGASSAASSASGAASSAGSRASSAAQSATSAAASSTPSSGATKNVVSGLAGVAAVAALLV